MGITPSDNEQDKILSNHEVRIVQLERDREASINAVTGLVKASAEQAKSIKILEKVMYGILALALATMVKVVLGIG